MKNLAIAKRYAKALMLISKEDNNVEKYKKELNAFVSLLEGHEELKDVIANPLYDRASRLSLLKLILDKLNLSIAAKSFLVLVFEKGRIKFIDDITSFYSKLVDEFKNIENVTIVSPDTLSDEIKNKIKNSLAGKTGKNIVLKTQEDPSIIGGLIVKINDLVLDGSLKTQLVNLKESFKRSESV